MMHPEAWLCPQSWIPVLEVHSEPHWVSQHLPSTAIPGTSETHAKVHGTDPLPGSKAGFMDKTGSQAADIHGRDLCSSATCGQGLSI